MNLILFVHPSGFVTSTLYNNGFGADSVCVCLCERKAIYRQSDGSDGAGAQTEVLLFRGGGQSELTQERTAGHLQGTQ